MPKRYIGFYTSKLFWVNEIIDPDDIRARGGDPGDMMEQEIFSHSTNVYSLKICRDGLFMVRIEALEGAWSEYKAMKVEKPNEVHKLNSKYYDYLNVVLLLFNSVLLKEHSISAENLHLNIGDAFPMSYGKNSVVASGSQKAFAPFLARSLNLYVGAAKPLSYHHLTHRLLYQISNETFGDWAHACDSILEDYDKVNIMSQIMVSIGNYRLLNFTASLIQSWFVIEYFINVYWFEFLRQKQIGFDDAGNWRNSKARDFLSDNKDITASMMTKLLDFSGAIDHDVFLKIDSLRTKRNKIAHNAEKVKRYVNTLKKNTEPSKGGNKEVAVTMEDYFKAFEVICYFAKNVYDVDLRISSVISRNSLLFN
jgi:hypothetical protein